MDKIPNEVISIILSHMPYDDMKAARFVCKKWYRSSLLSTILKNEKLVYDGIDHADRFSEMMNVVSERACPYSIQFSATSLDSNLNNFWETNGCKIHSIRFRKCSISRYCFYNMLELCINLKDIVLDECSDFLFSLPPINENLSFPKLLKVKHFTITGHNFTDFDFNVLMSCFPNLDSLALEVKDMCFHHSLFRRYYPNINNSNDLNSTDILTFDNVYHYITSHSQQIKSINLNYTKVTNMEIIRIANISGLRLRRVHLNNCSKIDGHGIKYLLERQNELEVLELCRSITFSNEILKAIVVNLSRTLKKLCVDDCDTCFLAELLSIMKMPDLEFLSFQHCSHIEHSGREDFTMDVPQYFNSNLKILKIRANVYDYCFKDWILKSFSMLKHLDLSYGRISVTNNFVQDICFYLKHLEVLKLCGCYHLKDDAFRANRSTMQFDLSDHMKELRVLDLGGCIALSNVTIQLLKFPSLRSLSLNGIMKCTSSGFLSLPNNCPLIRCINLAFTQVTDYDVLKLASSFKRLEIIYANNCNNVTSDVLIPLLEFPFIKMVAVGSYLYGRIDGTFVKKTFQKCEL